MWTKRDWRSLANISDGGKEVRVRGTYFLNETKEKNDNVVLLSIVKASDGNTVDLAEGLRKILPEIQKTLPTGVNT